MDQGMWPYVVTFNLLIDMLCQSWKMKESSELFELMAQRGIEPDGFTYSTLIDGYCLSGMIDDGRELCVSGE